MTRPRDRGDHDPVTAAVDPRRVGLQEAERGREIQRSPPPACLSLVVPRAAPPAMRAAILLLRARANRDHQRPIALVEIDLLNDRSPQSEQLLPYPGRAHVAHRSLRIGSYCQKPEP